MLNAFVVLAGVLVIVASGLFGIFLPLGRGVVDRNGNRVPAARTHLVRGLVAGAIGGLIVIIGLAGPFVEVPAGNVGVVTNFGRSRR